MKPTLTALLCLAMFHALADDPQPPEEMLKALQKEVVEKIWNQDEWEKKEMAIARALIAEFPERTDPYRTLLFYASGRSEKNLSEARAWVLEFAKGPAPDKAKAYIVDYYWDLYVWRECYEYFWEIGMYGEDNRPAPGEVKDWLEKHTPRWRMFLEAYSDFVEGRLPRPDNYVQRGANHQVLLLLDSLSRVTAEPEYRQHLKELNARWLALPDWSGEDRLELRSIQLFAQEADVSGQMAIEPKLNRHPINVYPPEVFLKVTRVLMKEFPGQEKPFNYFLYFAKYYREPWERGLFQELLDSQAPEKVKKSARDALAMMDRVGTPFEPRGLAIGGQETDWQAMKGKVLLIDFWATRDRPSVEDRFLLMDTYEKFQAKGLEIISIISDDTLETTESFLERNTVLHPPWTLYWNNTAVKDYSLISVRSLWLVDKKGIVRDVNALENLEQKIEKWLAEP